jgi:osmotically-inducible protein OsmY
MRMVPAQARATVFAVLCVIVACHSFALTEPAAHKRDPHFARLDTDNDGFLSYAEARADKSAAQNFALYDGDRDGRLSEDEFLRLKAAQARHRGGGHVRDGLITSRVKLAVLRSKDLKSAAVHVDTIAGVVKLSGEVETAKQSTRAEQLASRVNGVKRVENMLTVRASK